MVEYRDKTKEKVVEFKKETVKLVKDPDFQKITISTASGTVVIGAIGGAFGMASGMASGALAGLPPAIFTFGLSIPAGAMIGGGVGSSLGVATGASIGAAAGFGGYKYRVEIKDNLVYVKAKVTDKAQHGKLMILDSAEAAKVKVHTALGQTNCKASEL